MTDTTSSVSPCTNDSALCSSTPRNTGSSHSVRNSKFTNGMLRKPTTAASNARTIDGTTIVQGISCGSCSSFAGGAGVP